MSSQDHAYALPSGVMLEEYQIGQVLGSGGFGITYYAWDTHLDKAVAIKEYLPNEFAVRYEDTTVAPKSSSDAETYEWGLTRFLEEARILAGFDHPNINKVYRRLEAHGTAYMVLEYLPGESLSARLRRTGRLSPEEVWRLFNELLSGLAEVHRQDYVHRDIKPGNIMFREDGGAVLLDFGAARQAVGQRSKSITSILTPGYAPIEQYDQKAVYVGPWTDFYALGVVAYRCVTGVGEGELLDAVARNLLVSRGEAAQDMRPAVALAKEEYDQRLLRAIDWCMQVDQRERPQGITDLEAALAGGAPKIEEHSAPAPASTYHQDKGSVVVKDSDPVTKPGPVQPKPDKPNSSQPKITNSEQLARPRKVSIAIILLYSVLVIEIFHVFLESKIEEDDFVFLFFVYGILWLLMIRMIGKGKNWARTVFLMIVILGVFLSIGSGALILPDILGLAQAVQVIAAVLLFQGDSSDWFKAISTRPSGAGGGVFLDTLKSGIEHFVALVLAIVMFMGLFSGLASLYGY